VAEFPGCEAVTTDEVKAALRVNVGKRVRVTFADGVIQSVDIASVDDEGVLHSGPDGIELAHWWTRFESINEVEPGKSQILKY
jgi:hypothetical protein